MALVVDTLCAQCTSRHLLVLALLPILKGGLERVWSILDWAPSMPHGMVETPDGADFPCILLCHLMQALCCTLWHRMPCSCCFSGRKSTLVYRVSVHSYIVRYLSSGAVCRCDVKLHAQSGCQLSSALETNFSACVRYTTLYSTLS